MRHGSRILDDYREVKLTGRNLANTRQLICCTTSSPTGSVNPPRTRMASLKYVFQVRSSIGIKHATLRIGLIEGTVLTGRTNRIHHWSVSSSRMIELNRSKSRRLNVNKR